MEEHKDEVTLRKQVIILRYGKQQPSVNENAIMTETLHQLRLLERRFFLRCYDGADDDVKIDLGKFD